MAKKRGKAKTRTRAKIQVKKIAVRKLSQSAAVALLVVNILIPGLGSLIARKSREGVIQLILLLIGLVLSPAGEGLVTTIVRGIIGYTLIAIALVWALITSIKFVIESR